MELTPSLLTGDDKNIELNLDLVTFKDSDAYFFCVNLFDNKNSPKQSVVYLVNKKDLEKHSSEHPCSSLKLVLEQMNVRVIMRDEKDGDYVLLCGRDQITVLGPRLRKVANVEIGMPLLNIRHNYEQN